MLYIWYISPWLTSERLLSLSWYKRSEFGIRAAVFFSAATVSGAFGGLLAVRGHVFTSYNRNLRNIY
jgi:hypothetical protein